MAVSVLSSPSSFGGSLHRKHISGFPPCCKLQGMAPMKSWVSASCGQKNRSNSAVKWEVHCYSSPPLGKPSCAYTALFLTAYLALRPSQRRVWVKDVMDQLPKAPASLTPCLESLSMPLSILIGQSLCDVLPPCSQCFADMTGNCKYELRAAMPACTRAVRDQARRNPRMQGGVTNSIPGCRAE